MALREVYRPIISVQVVNECCANLLRRAKADEQTLRHHGNILLSSCEVVPLDQALLRQALALYKPGQWSWWDTMIIAAALANGCTQLWSEDLQHGRVIDDRLHIVNPLIQAP